MLKRIIFLFAFALVASPFLFAQITTSALDGTVKGNSDEPLTGASIVATHLPSGTKYTTITRQGGTFNIPNERITLPEALGIAGDLNITGVRKNILVIRDIDGKKTDLKLSFIYARKESEKQWTIVKEDAKKVGVDVDLKFLEWNSFLKTVDDNKMQL